MSKKKNRRKEYKSMNKGLNIACFLGLAIVGLNISSPVLAANTRDLSQPTLDYLNSQGGNYPTSAYTLTEKNESELELNNLPDNIVIKYENGIKKYYEVALKKTEYGSGNNTINFQ